MFADAIEKVGGFTRPIKTITRNYKEPAVVPGLATLFFVNDDGCAVTCKHVAQQIIHAQTVNKQYADFKAACARVPEGKGKAAAVKKLELVYKLKAGAPVQEKVQFDGTVSGFTGFDINMHPELDIAIIRFKGFERTLYKGHAVFVKDMKDTLELEPDGHKEDTTWWHYKGTKITFTPKELANSNDIATRIVNTIKESHFYEDGQKIIALWKEHHK